MLSSIAFAALLFAVSALMITCHVVSWRRLERAGCDDGAREFFRRQYRRRMQASAMIGFVGIAIIGGIWVRDPIYTIAYWGCVAIVVLWMGLLAVADMLSTRSYYWRLRREQIAEHASLQADLKRIRSREGNGRPKTSPGDPSDHEEV